MRKIRKWYPWAEGNERPAAPISEEIRNEWINRILGERPINGPMPRYTLGGDSLVVEIGGEIFDCIVRRIGKIEKDEDRGR